MTEENMKIIDCHTHIGGFGGIAKELAAKSVEDLIRSMDEADIAISLVIANNIKGGEEGTISEEVVEEVQKFPNRLRAIVNLDFPRLTEGDYGKSLLRMLESKWAVGLKLYSGYQQYDRLDEQITPFYDLCQVRSIPVIFHTGYLAEGVSGDREDAHPRVIVDLAKKFPKLTIIAAHFGNPWIKECGEIMREYQNVYADLSGYFTELQPISEKERQEFHGDIEKLKEAAGGLNKCLFGTDWWLYSQKEYKEALESLPLSEKERELLFYENARRIFNLE